MLSLLLCLLVSIIAILSLSDAQYFNCTGDWLVCYNDTMHCDSADCTVDCIGYGACKDASIHTHASNAVVSCHGERACYDTSIYTDASNAVVNCHGYGACRYTSIYAQTANSLLVDAKGKWGSLQYGYIECPENNYCNITANGDWALSYASIRGALGSKLFINASGDFVMRSANIYCPPDSEAGPQYSNNAVCDISVKGNLAMESMTIYANDGFANVRIECQVSNNDVCYEQGAEPLLYCGESLGRLCLMELNTNSSYFVCSDAVAANTCNNGTLPTPFPSTSPINNQYQQETNKNPTLALLDSSSISAS